MATCNIIFLIFGNPSGALWLQVVAGRCKVSAAPGVLSVICLQKNPAVSEGTNMVEKGQIFCKSLWKKIVWERAWALKDIFWRIECKMLKCLDFFEYRYSKSKVPYLVGIVQ